MTGKPRCPHCNVQLFGVTETTCPILAAGKRRFCWKCAKPLEDGQIVELADEPTCRDLGEQLCGTDRCVCKYVHPSRLEWSRVDHDTIER